MKEELRELLALERPRKRKNCYNSHARDISQLLCYNCKETGHYASHCPENKNGKGTRKSGYADKMKSVRDPSLVTCYKCNESGHYAYKCPEEELQARPRD